MFAGASMRPTRRVDLDAAFLRQPPQRLASEHRMRLDVGAGDRLACALAPSRLFALLRDLAQKHMLAANFDDLEKLDVGLIVTPRSVQDFADLIVGLPFCALFAQIGLECHRSAPALKQLSHAPLALLGSAKPTV